MKGWVMVLVVSIAFAAVPPALASDDDDFRLQWALARIEAEKSWATSTGRAVVVAVLDTGVDFLHPELRAAKFGAWDCLSDCKPTDTGDKKGHGTAVSGIISAATNNEIGIASAAPDARVLSVKVLDDDGRGGGDGISRGIRLAVDRGAKVVNMSLGPEVEIAGIETVELSQDFAYARSKGVLIVVAAGNDSSLMSSYAAAPDNVLVVGATGPNDEIAPYSSGSNISIDVDIYAPGGNAAGGGCDFRKCVLSTFPGGRYGSAQGTSFAAPHVAGVGAQLICLGHAYSAAIERMVSTADPIEDDGRRVNAAKAVGTSKSAACAASFPVAPNTATGSGSTAVKSSSSAKPEAATQPRGGTTGAAPADGDTPVQSGNQTENPDLTSAEAEEGESKGNLVLNLVLGGLLLIALASGFVWMQIKSRAARSD